MIPHVNFVQFEHLCRSVLRLGDCRMWDVISRIFDTIVLTTRFSFRLGYPIMCLILPLLNSPHIVRSVRATNTSVPITAIRDLFTNFEKLEITPTIRSEYALRLDGLAGAVFATGLRLVNVYDLFTDQTITVGSVNA